MPLLARAAALDARRQAAGRAHVSAVETVSVWHVPHAGDNHSACALLGSGVSVGQGEELRTLRGLAKVGRRPIVASAHCH